jgi:hypothetical protein
MSYSFFNNSTAPLNYLPDSVYAICSENDAIYCAVCSNEVSTPIGLVSAIERAKVFCPFGMGESLNKNIYSDQSYLTNLNNLPATTWGRVPQLTPRSISKIGLEWRTS